MDMHLTVPSGSKFKPEPDRRKLRHIANLLEQENKFLLTCHIRPDGDALGSILALGLTLMEHGKDVTIYSTDPVPNYLKFLEGYNLITNEVSPLHKDTTLIVIDCNEPKRIGPEGTMLFETAKDIIILDHHLGDEKIQENIFYYKEPSLFAAAAIIVWVIEELGWPITKSVAENLYTAILTDTGCFRHNNTTALAFAMAEKLVLCGARPEFVARMLYQNYSLTRLKLLALVLRTLEVKANGKIAIIQATPQMFRTSEATESDAEDFVSYARSLNTVEVAAFIREVHAGQCSVSLRSKTFFNVAEIAKKFGGGGHFNAAGFKATGNAPYIREILLRELESAITSMVQDMDTIAGTESGDV